ncbi:MAG TPA: serine/threonine-protein kinase [Polyangiaceae bacterium]|nr:serine/threonine-protein kinase [Polyangiaceae bacterium]
MYGQTGKFRDIVELGKGGMGDVFLTVASGPVGFNKLLVVKRLRESLASDPEFLRMFLNEARLAARLNHPNIVHTYEVGFDGSRHYIAMEYLEGQSLHRILRRASSTGGLSLEMQLCVLADALAGLHYAHELTDYDGTPLEIIHRDVSPANIFVLYDGQVKLVDFGIAKTANSTETKVGVFKGKIQYVSPEQYTGGPVDRRADIYSAGVVLWEAATRRRMWQNVGDLTVMHRVGTGDIPRPTSVDPQVPARLEAMCMKALAPRKEDRYPTAAALQADIEDFLQELGSRVSARDVGALTAKTFADDRAHVKLLIEDQLRLVRDYPDPQSLVPTVMLQQDTGSRPTAAESNVAPPFLPVRSRRRNVAIALAGGFALMVAGAVLWTSSPTGDPAPASANPAPAQSAPEPALAPPEPATAAVAVAPPAPPAPPQVRLIVETEPEHARVLVDGVLLPTGGEIAKFSKDNALHKVRAEATGFRPKTEWVRFDSDDVTVQINLDAPSRKGRKESKEGREAPAPSALSEATGNPSLAPAAQPPGASPIQEIESSSARRRSSAPPLDTADPWKK